MEPWYKVATLRKEVREGRSFNPDEFAIALEQVVAHTAPEDYSEPAQFFARTFFTRALREHVGMVLRRLSGRTDNTAPVLTLITQFGGGKTHTLAALYHLANAGDNARDYAGVHDLLMEAGVPAVPAARVAVFVGNAWDPQESRETPWIDVARQLAGDEGVRALGPDALTTPPGTEAIARVFAAANAPVLLLFDEVLNYLNRHRGKADSFHAFIQNLTVATTGTTHGACVISLPRSQVEMTEWDEEWQKKITKVVRRVAKDLIANDETEISEVVRRRLFEDLGGEKARQNVARAYASWCFDRRAQLPPEWTSVDSSASEAKARETLERRFASCYPFHPATLSVFQRKWQALPQYQQTRGALAMLAQWVALASQDGFRKARKEPLVTLGSAPLAEPDFRSVVLGQLGEPRLIAAIDADIAGEQAHARALDVDTSGPLRDIHRRVATVILFESSGGQTDKVAHLPELRFALTEPDLDTTSIDNAALAVEDRAYFIRRVGSDGFRIGYQPTMRKVVSDRRASLDGETEIVPAMRALVDEEWRRGATLPVELLRDDSVDVPDRPKLSLVVVDPGVEWSGSPAQYEQVLQWTRNRGASPRLYPSALVWCFRRQGRELRDKVELMLAWQRVAREVAEGTLGGEFDTNDRIDLQAHVKEADEAARDEVWAGYRFVVLADTREEGGLKLIDLGAGHASSGETLCGRTVTALKSEALLNESVGAGYIERNWPPAFADSGAWPLASLRQSFLNGALTRLIDPDATLRAKVVEFVQRGELGLASGQRSDGSYERLWFAEWVSPDEVSFEPAVFLLRKEKAAALKAQEGEGPDEGPTSTAGPTSGGDVTAPGVGGEVTPGDDGSTPPFVGPEAPSHRIRLHGAVPPEVWNRLGTRLIPKLRSGSELIVQVDFSVTVDGARSKAVVAELRQMLQELDLADRVKIEEGAT